MKILLIVGNANDIFITNMTKWLKTSMPDTTIDIFGFYLNTKQGKNTYYDNMYYVNPNIWHQKIPYIKSPIFPFYASHELKKFLKGRHYDIIHCHWIIPPLVLTRNIRKYCNRLFATFWGGEINNILKILYSTKLYNKNLKKFISEVDYIINSPTFKNVTKDIYPEIGDKLIEGNYGSEPLEELYKLMEYENKATSKTKLSIDTNKKVVLIGYSGKLLHQHIPIIDELSRKEQLKEKLHLLAPMTRGAAKDYCDKVQAKLEQSGYTYTLLRDSFLSNEEVARLRNATDITLQLSTSDGFSKSIIECLCAKSVLIYGDWLAYKERLKANQLIGHNVKTIKDGVDLIEGVLNNFENFKEETELNSKNGKAKNVWSECIKNWVNAYKNKK